jgi:hypothetical protein
MDIITIIIDKESIVLFLKLCFLGCFIILFCVYLFLPFLIFLETIFNKISKKIKEIYQQTTFYQTKRLNEVYPMGQVCIWCGCNNKRLRFAQRCSKCGAVL